MRTGSPASPKIPPPPKLASWKPPISPSMSRICGAVSGLWQAPPTFKATLVLAHGAGANMTHRSMAAIAEGLADLGVATLRYQFPYMEKGGKRPDTPAVAQATVRAAVAMSRRSTRAKSPLFAGGRSFGGRMTSGAQAAEPLAGVRGLVFFAFPLHLAGKPAVTRADHLADITIPMLFLSGSKDALAQLDLLGADRGPTEGYGHARTDPRRRPLIPRSQEDRAIGRRRSWRRRSSPPSVGWKKRPARFEAPRSRA